MSTVDRLMALHEAAIKAHAQYITGGPPQRHMAQERDQHTAALRAELEKAFSAEPVAWRDHVEQRLRTWKQSFVNRSGDQLALDDFMDQRSLDDLIDFVCDEYAAPPPAADAMTQMVRSGEALQRLIDQPAADAKDAARYRWLRLVDGILWMELGHTDPDGLDTAIDAAIAAAKEAPNG